VILEGQFQIPATRQRVWDAIWDVPTMASWVPGCTSASARDDGTYRAHLEQELGILKASFDLVLTVLSAEPPERIQLRAEGEDPRLRSRVQMETEVVLQPAGDSTVLRYRHDLSVFGRLGALGYPLIQRKARDIEAEFARRAAEALAGE
jgi:carbon monoxide dehydrogenase subunit G